MGTVCLMIATSSGVRAAVPAYGFTNLRVAGAGAGFDAAGAEGDDGAFLLALLQLLMTSAMPVSAAAAVRATAATGKEAAGAEAEEEDWVEAEADI